MNRLGFLILSILEQNQAVSHVSAMSVNEILEAEDYGYRRNTIFKKIKEFETLGYVRKGLKDGRADTFYITDAGSTLLKGIRSGSKGD